MRPKVTNLLNVNVSKSLQALKALLVLKACIKVAPQTFLHPFFSWQIEEVPGEMTQDDLATDDVMILDTWEQVRNAKHCHTAQYRGKGRTVLYLRVFLYQPGVHLDWKRGPGGGEDSSHGIW